MLNTEIQSITIRRSFPHNKPHIRLLMGMRLVPLFSILNGHGQISQTIGALRHSNTYYFQYCKLQQCSREYSAFTFDMSCRNAVVKSYQKVSSDLGQPSTEELGTINTFSLHCKPSGRNGQYEEKIILRSR